MNKSENEPFDVKKTFNIRRSTAEMIIELKLIHPNINIRYNILIDEAIRHYYEHIKEKGGF
ncbi:hypothetical protein [Clostridium intestinale]|uniref:Uncharacterized protein n=1 Tax=Clostridium intestinale URNW TaxID=1294142 RepID=U2NA53_9CLOT|nr:hypothetical protein [Clostridium intestinale]ERK32397.1 hypothetical protein CINTURNW_0321 [Clostridium intestinale URNW]